MILLWQFGRVLLLSGFLLTSLLVLPPGALAASAPAVESPDAAQVHELIQTLQDEGQRKKFIQQLELLVKVQQQQSPEVIEPNGLLEDLLAALSKRFGELGDGMRKLTAGYEALPAVWDWLGKQFSDPGERQFWKNVLINVVLVILAGGIGFQGGRRLLAPVRKRLSEKVPERRIVKAGILLLHLLLDLVPVAVFILAANLALGLVHPMPRTQQMVLAWIYVVVWVALVRALVDFLLAKSQPAFRFHHLKDETAEYLFIWISRLTRTALYGYFLLETLRIVGLPASVYSLLLKLLGLVFALLLVVLILQNRSQVADWLAGEEQTDESPAWRFVIGLRRRLGKVWHIVAILYVVFLFGIWALQVPGGALFLLKATVLSLIAVLVGLGALRLISLGLNRGLSLDDDLKARFPRLETRVNRYMAVVGFILRGLAYLLMVLVVAQAWGMDILGWFGSESGHLFWSKLARIIFIVILSVGVWEIANSFIEGYLAAKNDDGQTEKYSARTRTLLTVARKALLAVLVVIGSLTVLSELGIDIAPLLAGAGVLGLAVGFGAQKLVQDIITGVFILLEDLMAVGDVVNVGDKGGVVEAVNIRTVRLRDLSGTVHTIPYSHIDTVSNLTKEFSYYLLEVGIAYREDVDEVMQVLRDLGAELQKDPEYGPKVLEPLEILGLDKFGDSAIVIKARLKTIPIKQWWVGREFNRRMKRRFDELGIEIPFPHTTIYFGENKGGGAPPAFVQMASKAGVDGEEAPA